jgi:hypothetical protein
MVIFLSQTESTPEHFFRNKVLVIRQCVLCLPNVPIWYYQFVKTVEHFAILTNVLMNFTYMFVRTTITTTTTEV